MAASRDSSAAATPGHHDTGSEDSNPVSTIYRCRAPIASLDCMDEFSANSQQMLNQMARVESAYMVSHTTMPPNITPGLRYKNLGKSGLRVPNVALGLWSIYGPQVNEDTSEEIVNYALDNGINMFDLSEAHSAAKAELAFGKTLKKRGTKRASIIITTKVYWSTKSDERGLSRKHIVESIKASLQRLQVDYLDVVLLHKVDPVCPMEEMVRTMTFIINQGWAMYWGTARWSTMEIMDAYTNCRQFNCITPVVEQTEYHMFCREKCELHLPDMYHKIGIGIMVWSAITTGKGISGEDPTVLFAKSRFNRKYSTFSWCDEDIAPTEGRSTAGSKEAVAVEEPKTYAEKLRDLTSLACTLRCSLSQLAIAWCLKNEMVNCVLLGASSVRHLKENIDALQVVPQLTNTVMDDIERVLSNKPVRAPMVSTLAMRTNAQNAVAAALAASNSVHIDLTGATIADSTTPPKRDQGEALAIEAGETSTAGKAGARGACEVLSLVSIPMASMNSMMSRLKSRFSSQEDVRENKPKYFLNNAGEVICRTETETGITDRVVSVSSLKAKKPADKDKDDKNKVKKSKSDMLGRTRSASLVRSASGQVGPSVVAASVASTSRRASRFNMASPTPADV